MCGYRIAHFGLKRQYSNLKDELLQASHDALKDGQLMGGHFTRSFEEWLKHRTKTKYAVTVHSGTQALEIIAKYYKQHVYCKQDNVHPTPRIKIPNITYPATLNAFMSSGYTPILEDTDKYGIIQQAPYSIVCLVGLYGRVPWSDIDISKRTSVIVDGAQHWLEADGQVGLGMAISFDPTKNLSASGNGGAIVTNNEQLYLFAAAHRDNNKPYFHDVGTNSKMSEQDCAHLLVRAKYIDKWQERRELIAGHYREQLKDLPIILLNDGTARHANQKFVIYSGQRNTIHTSMLSCGIETKIHYEYTLGDLDISTSLTKPDMLGISVMLSRGVLSLPIYPELTDSEVEHVANTLRGVFLD